MLVLKTNMWLRLIKCLLNKRVIIYLIIIINATLDNAICQQNDHQNSAENVPKNLVDLLEEYRYENNIEELTEDSVKETKKSSISRQGLPPFPPILGPLGPAILAILATLPSKIIGIATLKTLKKHILDLKAHHNFKDNKRICKDKDCHDDDHYYDDHDDYDDHHSDYDDDHHHHDDDDDDGKHKKYKKSKKRKLYYPGCNNVIQLKNKDDKTNDKGGHSEDTTEQHYTIQLVNNDGTPYGNMGKDTDRSSGAGFAKPISLYTNKRSDRMIG